MSDLQHLRAAAAWWKQKITAPPWHEEEVEDAIFNALLDEWLKRLENSASWEEDIPPIVLTGEYVRVTSQTRANTWGTFLENALADVERKHPIKAPWHPTQMAVSFEQVQVWVAGAETIVWQRKEKHK